MQVNTGFSGGFGPEFHRNLHLFGRPFRNWSLLGQRSPTARLRDKCLSFALMDQVILGRVCEVMRSTVARTCTTRSFWATRRVPAGGGMVMSPFGLGEASPLSATRHVMSNQSADMSAHSELRRFAVRSGKMIQFINRDSTCPKSPKPA